MIRLACPECGLRQENAAIRGSYNNKISSSVYVLLGSCHQYEQDQHHTIKRLLLGISNMRPNLTE